MAANTKLTKSGYGQIQLNQVVFRRNGHIEAQCALDETDFAKTITEETSKAPCENGLFLAVDQVNRKIKLPTAGSKLPVALNYTTEHMYEDVRSNALKDYVTRPGSFYPRLGYVSVGEKFVLNTVCWDTSDSALALATESALLSALAKTALTSVPLYGIVCADSGYEGYIALANASTLPTNPIGGIVLQVAQADTMPDGQLAVKFAVIQA